MALAISGSKHRRDARPPRQYGTCSSYITFRTYILRKKGPNISQFGPCRIFDFFTPCAADRSNQVHGTAVTVAPQEIHRVAAAQVAERMEEKQRGAGAAGGVE
jgi:hypothetical protein